MKQKSQKQGSQTLGQYIAEAMERDRRTGAQIAKTVGIDGSHLSKIKGDEVMPSPEVLERLIQELDLNPERARQLAEAAKAKKSIEKAQRQLDRSQGSLRIFRLNAFYRGWQRLRPRAASRSKKEEVWIPVVVMDTQQGTVWDIDTQIIGEPEIDKQGFVYFRLHSPQVANLPDEFSLEIIFLAVPSPECLCSTKVGPQEKGQLGTIFGLELRAKLPDAPELDRFLKSLNFKGKDRVPVGTQGGFAFRIIF